MATRIGARDQVVARPRTATLRPAAILLAGALRTRTRGSRRACSSSRSASPVVRVSVDHHQLVLRAQLSGDALHQAVDRVALVEHGRDHRDRGPHRRAAGFVPVANC